MQVKTTTPLARIEVGTDARGLTSRAGTVLLSGLADRLGLTDAPVAGLKDIHCRRVVHDPGSVVADLAVMVADGGDALCDLGALRTKSVRQATTRAASAFIPSCALRRKAVRPWRVCRAQATPAPTRPPTTSRCCLAR